MLKEYLSTLANTFRNVLGTADKINAGDFTSKISEVYEKGKSDGGDTETAYNEGVKAGKQAEYDRFWDTYQDNGNRGYYRYAFHRSYWNDYNFKPKYDIIPFQDGQYMFQQCSVTDMKSILEGQGVKLDFSRTTSLYYCFAGSTVTHLPELNCAKCINFQNTFANCSSLVSIDKIIVSEKVTGSNFARTFGGCSALENVIFEGTIATDISFEESPLLSHDSIMSIINCLKDYAGTTTTYTLTLGTTNLAKLTDSEKAVATQKGWTLA